MGRAEVVAIYLHAGAESGDPMTIVESATAVESAGLLGDRFYQGDGSRSRKRGPDRELTLIESEVIEALNAEGGVTLTAEESRRNVVTRGVELNPLVGQTFRVGGATLHGMRLCEPCDHLERLTRPGILAALVHRGGLRARVVEGGEIRVGDPIEVAPIAASKVESR